MINKIFGKDLRYKRKFINTCISRIRSGKKSEKTVLGYKTYIFKVMKNIVTKNIRNYMNLLNGSPCRYMPDYNEILSECYIVFDKCLEKYKITKTNSFLFYYNKALSRNFYKLYTREMNMPKSDLSDEIMSTNKSLHDVSNVDDVELLMYNIGLSDIEKRVCMSKIKGEFKTEFLKKNKDITHGQYCRALKNVKLTLQNLMKKNKY